MVVFCYRKLCTAVSFQEFRFMKHSAPVVKTHRRSASGTVHVTTETSEYCALCGVRFKTFKETLRACYLK